MLGNMVLVRIFLGSLAGVQDTNPCLLLTQNSDVLVAVIYRG